MEPVPPPAPRGTLEVDGALRNGQPWPTASPSLPSGPEAAVVDVDEPAWWDAWTASRLLLLATGVLVLALDTWLLVRWRRRRRYG